MIDGKALALQVRERLATESAAVLAKTGMKPGLAIDNDCYVAIDKIVAVWEKRDKDRHPGFVFKS